MRPDDTEIVMKTRVGTRREDEVDVVVDSWVVGAEVVVDWVDLARSCSVDSKSSKDSSLVVSVEEVVDYHLVVKRIIADAS